MGRKLGLLLVALCGVLLWLVSPSMGSSDATESFPVPTPQRPIVGKPIKIPAVLFESGAPGSPSVVTPAQANAVATAMWSRWEIASVENDTRALTQLAAPGPMLASTINSCASAVHRCTYETHPHPLTNLVTVVPLQDSYPAYFLAEVQTTAEVSIAGGLMRVEPWLDIQILTKASRRSPWKLSFITGYDGTNGSVPPLIDASDGAAGPRTPTGAQDYYNIPVTHSTAIPPAQYLSRLASYWQSYKNTGHPPAHNAFVNGGDTSGVGEQLALDRQGSVYLGHRLNFKFSADTAAGSWEFSAGSGWAMECGAVRDRVTSTPLSGVLYQNPDESNWGVPLPPGEYSRITLDTDREMCVFGGAGGLDVYGNFLYTANVTGTRVAGGVPTVTNPTLSDLETQFGILAYQVQQYQQTLNSCKQTRRACEAAFGKHAAVEAAKFANELATDKFPIQASSAAARLEATARTLTHLFGQLQTKAATTADLNTIVATEQMLDSQYKALVTVLSKH